MPQLVESALMGKASPPPGNGPVLRPPVNHRYIGRGDAKSRIGVP